MQKYTMGIRGLGSSEGFVMFSFLVLVVDAQVYEIMIIQAISV